MSESDTRACKRLLESFDQFQGRDPNVERLSS